MSTLRELAKTIKDNRRPMRLSVAQKKLNMTDDEFERFLDSGCFLLTPSKKSVKSIVANFRGFAYITGRYVVVTRGSRHSVTYGDCQLGKELTYTTSKYSPDFDFLFSIALNYAFKGKDGVDECFKEHNIKQAHTDLEAKAKAHECTTEEYLESKRLGKVEWAHNTVYDVHTSTIHNSRNDRYDWRYEGKDYHLIGNLSQDAISDLKTANEDSNGTYFIFALRALFEHKGYTLESVRKRQTKKEECNRVSPTRKVSSASVSIDSYREYKRYNDFINHSYSEPCGDKD